MKTEKEEKKVVTGHIKIKRKYGDRFFRERVSQAVRSILADLYPYADEIDIKFYRDRLPAVLSSQINHVFEIRDSMPKMITTVMDIYKQRYLQYQ